MAEPDVPVRIADAPAWLRRKRRRFSRARRTIVCAGDSVTRQPDPPTPAWPQALAPRLGQFAYVRNAGLNGDRTFGLYRRLPNDVLSHMPQDVPVMIGVNDILLFSAATIEANLRAIYTSIVVNGGRPLPITILPFGASVDWTAPAEALRLAVNAWIRTQPFTYTDGEALGDFTVPAQPVLKAGYSTDGKHLSYLGADVLAQLVFTTVYGGRQVAHL